MQIKVKKDTKKEDLHTTKRPEEEEDGGNFGLSHPVLHRQRH